MVIAELAVGGGTLGIGPMPGRDGAYLADMATLKAWDPWLVLTMATSSELASAGAAGLGDDVKLSGAWWMHLPIPDYGAPDALVESQWTEAAQRALDVLASGGKVWVHCMGGCGRSGMAALRLMVEAGEEPSLALGRLRAVRPCAVESPQQYKWAAEGSGAL